MKKLLTLIAMLTIGFGYQNCHEPSGWCYDISTQQCFYMFETAVVDTAFAEYQEEVEDDNDVIGAFCGTTMVGFAYADASYITVPAMGNDGSLPGYCDGTSVPTFQLYDASNDVILDADVGEGVETPLWALNAIHLMPQLTANNTFGCYDADACNYNPDATAEGECTYPSGCDNQCDSDLEFDDCGVCGGDGSDDQGCGCFEPAPSGCDNTCGSTLEFDDCGVCGGDDSSCTGCTDDLADNYDSGNTIDDGSCEYTIPAVSDLSAEDGPERAILAWTAPASMGDASYTYDVVSGGEVVKADLIGTSTQVLNLEPDVEACFTVVAKKCLW